MRMSLPVLVVLCATFPAMAQTVSPLISISPAEYLTFPETAKAVYVGGILDGMTFATYGHAAKEHDAFVHCASTLTLGALAQKTTEWLQAHSAFSEGTASAVARTMGQYCKAKGLR